MSQSSDSSAKQDNPIKQFMSRIDRLSKEQEEEGSEPNDILKYDVVPLLIQMARLWHDHASWSSSRAKEAHDFTASLYSAVEQMKSDIVSMGSAIEELRESSADVTSEYETQFTVEDAEKFEKYLKATMTFISSTAASETKEALLERGQQLLSIIEQNVLVLEEEEEEQDADDS